MIESEQAVAPCLDPARVRRVALLSDLHLGAENCVLSRPGQLARLTELLSGGPHIDALILGGDVCDFALATMRDTLAATRAFMTAIAPLAREIVYVPGNHDHHNWLLANELHELVRPFPALAAPFLRRTERRYRDTFLGRLIDLPSACELSIAYPNLYWRPHRLPGHTYVFHHGHYCEELYSIVFTTLRSAFPDAVGDDLERLESLSFGWLELVWYQLGQAGAGVGAHGLLEHLYELVRTDGAGELRGGLERLSQARVVPLLEHALRERWWLPNAAAPGLARLIGRQVPGLVIALLGALGARPSEVRQPGASAWRFRRLDDDLARHCADYIARTRRSPHVPEGDAISFFFGHTHVAGTWGRDPAWPEYFNDGGWIFGPRGEWPDAHVFFLEDDGEVADLSFQPDDARSVRTVWRPAAQPTR
jgi:hypothetical protein